MASFWPFGSKSRDYGKHEKPNRHVGGLFSTGAINGGWTDSANFASRARALLFKSPVSRRCFEIRAEKLASITLNVENGNENANLVLSKPNFFDRTMSNLLHNIEMDLGINGDAWLFLNLETRGRPVLETLRPDFIKQEPADGQIFYDPADKLGKGGRAELVFTMDPEEFGRTAMVERLIGGTDRYETISGALLHIRLYNPLSSLDGSGSGDAILSEVAAYDAAMRLVYARFANGGRKAGYITIPDIEGFDDLSDEQMADVRRKLESLRDDAELKALVSGSDFISNQMTFAELDVVEVVKASERRIAMALGVQPVMLGFEGETTGMNMRTADRTFYTGWLKPRADFILGNLQSFLADELDCPKLSITIDETKLPYLQDDKLEKVDKMAGRGALTFNEYRREMGYPDVEWGDQPIPVAGAGEALASRPDREPEQQPDNAKPREVSHGADTSRRADQRA